MQLVAILTYSWSQGEDTDQHLLHHPDNWILMDHLHLHTWNNPATILYLLISDHSRSKWFNHGKVLKAIEDDLHFEYLQQFSQLIPDYWNDVDRSYSISDHSIFVADQVLHVTIVSLTTDLSDSHISRPEPTPIISVICINTAPGLAKYLREIKEIFNDLNRISYSTNSSKFHHLALLALLVALVSHSSNLHHWPLLVALGWLSGLRITMFYSMTIAPTSPGESDDRSFN